MSPEGKLAEPILAAEFNDAIPAGNNAWQRFPRIAQAAGMGIPFLYVVTICDAEVKDGNIRSLRHPNSVIQIAQLMLMERFGVPSLTVYLESPWFEDGLREQKATTEMTGKSGEEIIAGLALKEMIRKIGLQDSFGKKYFVKSLSDMLHQARFFAISDFTLLKGHPILSEDRANEVIESWWSRVENCKPVPAQFQFWRWSKEQILAGGISFSKALSTASVYKTKVNPALRLKTNASMRDLQKFCGIWSIPMNETSRKALFEEVQRAAAKRPLSYKSPPNEVAFIYNSEALASILSSAYPQLEEEVVSRIHGSPPPVLFLPIAGYVKDTGGPAFSRPDKGLVGLVSALFGSREYFPCRIVLLYSELVPSNWKVSLEAAVAEGGRHKDIGSNNLWREIAALADVVICDIHGNGVVL